jgi:enoyl-CoA hydratase
MTYENITSETRDAVGIITLNRPKTLNALNSQLIDELNSALSAFQDDPALAA